MAWTAPATASVGTLDTAALWNTQVRDNLLYLSGPAHCRVTTNVAAGQSLTSGTPAALVWNVDTYDTQNIHSTTSNTSRFVVPAGWGGLYAIQASVTFAGNGTGIRNTGLYVNGAAWGTWQAQQNPPGANTFNVAFYEEIVLAAGSYVEIWANQTSGAALAANTTNGGPVPYVTMRWVATS